MSTSLRLNDELVHEAEAEGRLTKRTPPKQIEFWAEIGKAVAESVRPNELLALLHGLAEVRIEPARSVAVDPDEVFDAVERERGTVSLTGASVYYESSRTKPGLLDRVQSDGSRESGHFREGRFVPVR